MFSGFSFDTDDTKCVSFFISIISFKIIENMLKNANNGNNVFIMQSISSSRVILCRYETNMKQNITIKKNQD